MSGETQYPVREGFLLGRGRSGSRECGANVGESILFRGGRQPAVMPDFLEAVWEDVVEKAADEFLSGNCIEFLPVVVLPVAPGIRDETIGQ